MKYSMLFAASLVILALAACEKPTVINTPAPMVNTPPPSTQIVPVPVPGPQGQAGAEGAKGDPGKGGDTVVVVPPATK
jgi:hypothetical protein